MRKLLLFSVLSISLSIAANGKTIEYTDRESWETAVGEFTNINFDGLATSTGSLTTTSLSIKGVTFSGAAGPVISSYAGLAPDPNLIVVSAADPSNAYVRAWGPGDKLMANLGGMNALLPSGTTAFGVNIMSTSTYFGPTFDSAFKIVLSNGEVFDDVFASRPPITSFIGFVSTDPLSSVYLNSYSSFPMIDNFSFVSTAPLTTTPEPATYSASFAGLILIMGCFFIQYRDKWKGMS